MALGDSMGRGSGFSVSKVERSFVLGQATGSDRMGNHSSAEAGETVYPVSGEGFTEFTDNVIVQVNTEDACRTSP